jgi:molybdopterin converting factor small subunit
VITVEVVLPGVLTEDAGGAHTLDVRFEAPTTGARVCEVLDGLAALHPRLGRRLRDEQGVVRRHVNLFVDGDDIRATGGQDTPVRHGSTLYVLPNVAGG